MDVDSRLLARQRHQLVPGPRDRLGDGTADLERPLAQRRVRRRARRQNREDAGDVLGGWDTGPALSATVASPTAQGSGEPRHRSPGTPDGAPGPKLGCFCRSAKERRQGVAAMQRSIDSEIEDVRVYAWRVEQLGRLGISIVIASAVANVVDWHEVARLVQNGCPAELALEIAR